MPPGNYGPQPPQRRSGAAGKTFGCLIVVPLIGGGLVFGIGTAAGWVQRRRGVQGGLQTNNRYGGCDGASYMADSEKTSRTSGVTLCMTLNARMGDCFNQAVGPPTGTSARTACDLG